MAGHSELSAGAIQIQAAGQNAISAPPVSRSDGVTYQTALPRGFVGPGQYTISAPPSAPVTFQQTMTVGHPISIQNGPAPGTVIGGKNLPTITWTGGDSSSIIRVTLIGSVSDIYYQDLVYYFSASAGSLTLPNIAGLPGSSAGELILEVLPASGIAASVTAQGISQQVQFSWSYKYIFGGLTVLLSPM